MTEEGLFTILAAMRKSFEFCDLRMMTRGYYMATCSADPIQPREFHELPADLDLIDQIQVGLLDFDLDEFFNDIRISENIFDHFEPTARLENTDDHPVLEFMVVRGYQIGEMGEDPFLDRQDQMNIEPVRLEELDGSSALLRRAASFYHLGADHFRANFLPLLRNDPATWNEWLYWGFDDDPND